MNIKRQTIAVLAAGLVLAGVSAVHAAPAVRTGLTFPKPFPCTIGGCRPPCGDFVDDCPKPEPHRPWNDPRNMEMSSFKRQAVAVTAAVGSQDFSAASASLNALFTGSASKGSVGGAVVVAGNPPPPEDEGVNPPAPKTISLASGWDRRVVPPLPYLTGSRASQGPRFVTVGYKGCAVGVLASDSAAGCGIGSAAEDGFNDIIDKVGNYLRDRNDDKLHPGK